MSPMPVSVPVASARKIRTNGQREPVVDPGLDVEQPAQPQRNLGAADDGRGEDRVGGGEDGADQQRGGPVEADEVVGGDGDEHQRQRHAQPEGAAGQPPAGAQLAQRQSAAVDEQHGEQGEVGEPAHQRSLGGDLDQPEDPGADERPGDQEHQRGRQHRPGRQPGEGDRDQQHDAEGQDQDHAALPGLTVVCHYGRDGRATESTARAVVVERRPRRSSLVVGRYRGAGRSGRGAGRRRGPSEVGRGYAAVSCRATRTRSGSGTCGPLRDDRELAPGLVEDVADVAERVHSVAPQVGQHLALDQPASA